MTSLARSTSPTLDAVAALDELRARLRSCKAAATTDIRMSFHDASDMISRIQSELAGAEPSIPLSAVEALGLLKGRLGATDNAELALECGIAASLARSASERISRMERRVSITSQTYLNRLAQYLNAFART